MLALGCGPTEPAIASDEGGDRVDPALVSPYRNERRRAREEFLRRDDPDRLTPLLHHEDLQFRRAAAQILTARPEWLKPEQARPWIGAESSAEVLDRMVDALLAATQVGPGQARDWLAAAQEGGAPLLRESRFTLGRAQVVFEEVMSEESIPGFYDGQFQGFWPIAADMDERLIAVSRDERFHFVIRVLAVMALHESRRETLPDDLAPLIMNAHREFEITRLAAWSPRPSQPHLVLERRRADLSRYARYSLAKAGFTAPILEYITRMDQELLAHAARMKGGDPILDDNESEQFFREWLQGLLFETGYYFQQFDDYENAKRRYLRLVERFPESRSCQNAYYNLACIAAIQKQIDTALAFLESAVTHGFNDHEWLREDGDLTSLRGHPEFERIVELARTGQFTAGARDLGTAWLSKLRQFIPPNLGFFELPKEQQKQVLTQGAGLLTGAEWRLLLDSAPATQRAALQEMGRELRAQGLLRDG